MLSKLDRLTFRRETDGAAFPVWRDASIACGLGTTRFPCEKCDGKNCDLGLIIQRLAAYEDSRLTPDEVLMLKHKQGSKPSKKG